GAGGFLLAVLQEAPQPLAPRGARVLHVYDDERDAGRVERPRRIELMGIVRTGLCHGAPHVTSAAEPARLGARGRIRHRFGVAATAGRGHPRDMRQVTVLAFPRVQTLDITGPVEVFSIASRLVGRAAGYRIEVVAPTAGAVRTWSGLGLVADRDLAHAT